jgi:hypothetical protein
MKKTIFAICIVLGLVSCDLEREDFTEISPETFPKTESDLRLAVNALYYEFGSGYWNGEGIYGAGYGGYQVLSDMTTDALWSGWGWESDDLYYQQWFATVTGDIQNHCYQNFAHYQFLSKARNTIRRLEASDAPEEAKRLYIGETKALRGWMALYLYDLFGPVPVASDEVLDEPETFNYIGRLSDEEYDQMMESDLRDAIAALPEKPAARGRMTKGSAMMILLKYYMIRGKFQQAETLARELTEMEGRVYNLLPDYNSIFTKENLGNSEIILQVPCNSSSTWTSNYMTAEVLPSDMAWTEKSQGWGGYVIPWAFYDTFEAGDARTKNLLANYTNTYGQQISRENPNGGQLAYGALPLKYGKDPDMTGAQSGIDLVIYRYSDVLLTLAECIVRNGNVNAEAINLVNRVRNRAGLGALSETQTSSKDVFLKALLAERGHEFWLEGLRRQDLIRFGLYAELANQRIQAANANGKNYFPVTEAHNRFWIPQTFIDESKSAIKQNTGY